MTPEKRRHLWLYLTLFAVILLIAIGVVLGLIYSKETNTKNKEATSSYHESSGEAQQEITYGVATEGDYGNFVKIISKNQIIQDLPEDSKILLNFYNFNTGEREWEKNYILSKGKVTLGTAEDYDIKLVMHSKYLTILKEDNFCQVVQTAKNNGDFGSEIHKSAASLLWKYRGILGYRECLGF